MTHPDWTSPNPTGPRWVSGAELASRYVVGEARLWSFSQRGTLPFARDATGAVCYDERVVAKLFRARDASASATLAFDGRSKNLGVLGVTTLGGAGSTGRPHRRRAAAPFAPFRDGTTTPRATTSESVAAARRSAGR